MMAGQAGAGGSRVRPASPGEDAAGRRCACLAVASGRARCDGRERAPATIEAPTEIVAELLGRCLGDHSRRVLVVEDEVDRCRDLDALNAAEGLQQVDRRAHLSPALDGSRSLDRRQGASIDHHVVCVYLRDYDGEHQWTFTSPYVWVSSVKRARLAR